MKLNYTAVDKMSADNVGIVTLSSVSVTECRWEINTSCIFGKRRGDAIKSPAFSTGCEPEKRHWALEFYPKGQVEATENYTSIFLEYLNPNKVKAAAVFSILNHKEDEVIGFQTEKHLFQKFDLFGYHDFVLESFIHNPDNHLINHDKLIIECKIITEENSLKDLMVKNNCNWNMAVNDFEKLFANKEFSDIIVMADEKKFHLHKCILANKSPVFKAMFTHDLNIKNRSTIDIKGIKWEILEEFFRFIYTGQFERIEKIACEILDAAEKFSVSELKTYCEKVMCDNLTEDTAILYLNSAQINNAEKLKWKAVEFIAIRLRDYIEKPEFQSYRILHPEMFNEIVKQNLLMKKF